MSNIYQANLRHTHTQEVEVDKEQEKIDTNSSEATYIEETYDQVQSNNSSKKTKNCKRTWCWRSVSLLAIAIALVALVVVIITNQRAPENSNTAIPLTQDDWTRINQFIADKVTKGIEQNISSSLSDLNNKIDSFANRIAKIEAQENVTAPEFKSLQSELVELRKASQEYQNNTTATILELSEQSGHIERQITTLHGLTNSTVTDIDELSLLHTQTQKQVDNIRNRTYQLEEQQNITLMELETLNNTAIRVETGFKEFNSSFIDSIKKNVTKLEVEQELLSTNVSILSSEVHSYHSNNAALPNSSTTVICLTFIIGLYLVWF